MKEEERDPLLPCFTKVGVDNFSYFLVGFLMGWEFILIVLALTGHLIGDVR